MITFSIWLGIETEKVLHKLWSVSSTQTLGNFQVKVYFVLHDDHVVYLSFLKDAVCQCYEFSICTEIFPILFKNNKTEMMSTTFDKRERLLCSPVAAPMVTHGKARGPVSTDKRFQFWPRFAS